MSKKISDEVAFDLQAVLNDRLQQVIDEVVSEFTKPEPSLPVGTRVRVLEDEAYYASVSKGDIGTVIRATEWADEEGEVTVVIDGDDTEWTFRPGVDIEVVTEFQIAEEKAKAALPFKVGDRVRILEDDAWLAPVKKGDLATITDLCYSTYNGAYFHASVDAKGTWYFRPQDLEAADIAVGDTVEVGYHVNNVWAGLGKVTKIVEFGFSGKPIAHVEMTTGEMKGSLGGFDVDELVKVEKTEPAFAKGDRVFCEDYGFGTVESVDEEPCCGSDEIKVAFDDGKHDYFGYDGNSDWTGAPLESLDERELVRLTEYEFVAPGDELILATLAGDHADIQVGEKVTVTNVAWGNLVNAETADGRTTTRYASRFARA